MVSREYLNSIYQKMPNKEAITLTTYRGVNRDTVAATSIEYAWQRELARDDIAQGLVTTSETGEVWHVPDAFVSSAGINQGDTITDSDSVIWTVMSSSRVRSKTHWRCITRREA